MDIINIPVTALVGILMLSVDMKIVRDKTSSVGLVEAVHVAEERESFHMTSALGKSKCMETESCKSIL